MRREENVVVKKTIYSCDLCDMETMDEDEIDSCDICAAEFCNEHGEISYWDGTKAGNYCDRCLKIGQPYISDIRETVRKNMKNTKEDDARYRQIYGGRNEDFKAKEESIRSEWRKKCLEVE